MYTVRKRVTAVSPLKTRMAERGALWALTTDDTHAACLRSHVYM